MLRKVHLYRFTLPKYTKSGRYRPLTNKLHQINEDGKYFIYNELESGGKKRAKRNSITLADAQCLLWWSVSYVRETWLLRFKPSKMAFPSLCCLFRAIYQSPITCCEFIVENIYCRCGFLQRAVSFAYTTLQKHAVTLYETSRNAPLDYDLSWSTPQR